MSDPLHTWANTSTWGSYTHIWGDVQIIDDALRRALISGTDTIPLEDDYIKKWKKRIITIMCRVDNITYKQAKEKFEGGKCTVQYMRLVRSKLIKEALKVTLDDIDSINITYTDRK